MSTVRLRLPPVLRVFLLGLLVLGLVVKPVLVVACDIACAQEALVGEHEQATQAPDTDPGDDCCPGQSCNECCAHTVALMSATVAATAHVNAGPLRTLSAKFEPTAYPVGFRPPIAG